MIVLLASASIALAAEPPINLLVNQAPQQAAPATTEASIEVESDDVDAAEVPAELKRQTVDYATREAPGTIVVDTEHTHLYFVLGGGKAVRYGIGVGRDGFTWAGREKITKMAEWPDWHPPSEMIERQPYLPRFVAGGPGNPLGARAMYLGKTVYRIHGTNQPGTIGKFVSSGCIRLTNEDVEYLYSHVKLGAPVVVLPKQVAANDLTGLTPAEATPASVPLPRARPVTRHKTANRI
ncbi:MULTISPECIES: L,D-transpeptidase [unclassified Bradyrhizobium]